MKQCLWVLIGSVAWAAAATAEPDLARRQTVYVNNVTGSDELDGHAEEPAPGGGTGPVKSITHALALAPPGALVSIANTGRDYRESVRVDGHAPAKPDITGPRPLRGSAALPLVLDGHGATVSGLVTVPADRWTHLENDIYWFENRDTEGRPGPMPNSNWLGFLKHQGWFTEPQAPEIFFLEGKPAPHAQALEKIPAGGFFYDTLSRPRRLYFRLPEGRPLEALTIDVPLNQGVFVDADYVVVRNLQSMYSQDDGFAGFWGYGVVFENCNGSFNCDQGISLHGTSVTLIDGGRFERNGGAGIVDVMSCTTLYRNCEVRDNLIAGALLQGTHHSLANCRFSGNAGAAVGADKDASVYLRNCVVAGSVSLLQARVESCTLTSTLDLREGARVSNSLFRGHPAVKVRKPSARPSFSASRFVAPTLLVGDREIAVDGFQAFAAESGLFKDCAMDPEDDGEGFGSSLPADIGYREAQNQ